MEVDIILIMEKKKNVKLPQLIKLYNKNDFLRNNNNLYYGYSYKNKYYK